MKPRKRSATGSLRGARPIISISVPGTSPMSRRRRPISPGADTEMIIALSCTSNWRSEILMGTDCWLELSQWLILKVFFIIGVVPSESRVKSIRVGVRGLIINLLAILIRRGGYYG